MPLLAVLFLVVPVAELWVIIASSRQFGFLNTLGVLIVISMLGAWLIKREGMKVWRRFNAQIASGAVPSNEIADGVLVLGAGALLMTPGFLTDIVGLLALFPPTRALLRRVLVKRFTGRGKVVKATYGGSTRRGPVFDTTAHDAPADRVDPPDSLDMGS